MKKRLFLISFSLIIIISLTSNFALATDTTIQNHIIDGASNAVENYENAEANENQALNDAKDWMKNYTPSDTTTTSSNTNSSSTNNSNVNTTKKSKTSSLPQTGTNIINLIILAIFLTVFMIFNYKNRKIK